MPHAAAPAPSDLFQAAPNPMAVLAADGALLSANDAFREAFRHAITPQRPPWGRVTPPPFAGGLRRFEAAAPDGRSFEWAEQMLADGSRLAIAHDVTERVRAAEEVNRAKTTLFATLTHELRTPLNGVLGMAGLLAQGPLSPSQREYVDAVLRSGEHLLDLITEILDYSRLDAGRVALESAPFDAEEIAQSVVELLSPKAHAKGLELIAVMAADAPQRLLGDEGRVRQILFNLAGNAVKFTQSGGVVVGVGMGRPAPDGRPCVRFSVRDTGPGVAPDKQALIFEEFQQADAETARRFGGAGLGLAIVKRLADAMGGRVGLESSPGLGALFWADLPLPAVEAAPPWREPPLSGLAIGVVSRPLLTSALEEILPGLGARCVRWSAGMKIDALLLDDAIASGDPSEFLARTGAPVIVLAPQEAREVLEPYRKRGAAAYLLKPLRRTSLVERIRRATRGPAPQAPPAAAPPSAGAPGSSGGGGPRLDVLLAEDNPVNALLARTMLTRLGCAVEVVTDGEQAIAAAGRRRFDVVFLDLRMPALDGVAAARRIRGGAGPSAASPIFALTADAGEAERASALGAGMDGFLTKPIDATRLQAVLARLPQSGKPSTVSR